MKTPAIELLTLLKKNRFRIFTTADIQTLTGLASDAATQALRRLSQKGAILKIKRGLWASQLEDQIHPYEVVPFLRAPWPTYVSLYNVLADHGIIEEVPHLTYAIYAGQPQKIQTPLGTYHIHHLPPSLIWGYEMKTLGGVKVPIAEPEKAFLDLVYLSLSPRSRLQLPEKRGRHWDLDRKKLLAYGRRYRSKKIIDTLNDTYT